MLVGLSMLLLLTVVGLVIDGSTMYAAKSELQKAANAAVLSGAQELTTGGSSVESIVKDILSEHDEQNSLVNMDIEMNSTVRVQLRKKVALGFGKLFGKEYVTVSVKAGARIETMGAAAGAAPLGIDDSIPLEYYREYKLKVDSSEVDRGNFGILALDGPGASTYERNLKYGYQGELQIGDVVDTQTGNIAGKTREGVQYRINQCPNPQMDFTLRDCARIILIPVYKPYNHTEGKQLKQIEITGFAYFYITEPMAHNDTSIRGMFIERAGTGYTKPGAVSRGAYAIKLVE